LQSRKNCGKIMINNIVLEKAKPLKNGDAKLKGLREFPMVASCRRVSKPLCLSMTAK